MSGLRSSDFTTCKSWHNVYLRKHHQKTKNLFVQVQDVFFLGTCFDQHLAPQLVWPLLATCSVVLLFYKVNKNIKHKLDSNYIYSIYKDYIFCRGIRRFALYWTYLYIICWNYFGFFFLHITFLDTRSAQLISKPTLHRHGLIYCSQLR